MSIAGANENTAAADTAPKKFNCTKCGASRPIKNAVVADDADHSLICQSCAGRATPFAKLTKDLKAAASTLTATEAKYFVSTYYQTQNYRITAFSQEKMLMRAGEPHELMTWLAGSFESLENEIRKALDVYSDASVVGRWARSIPGIGPVIAAGLLAYIDPERARTAGNIWSFAGLNPERPWLGSERAKKAVSDVVGDAKEITDEMLAALGNIAGRTAESVRRISTVPIIEKREIEGKPGEYEDVTIGTKITRRSLESALSKRPWNSDLKVLLAFKLGESFVKVQNNEKDFYGKLFRERKDRETQKNLAGEYRTIAEQVLAAKKIGRDTDAYAAYSEGMLPKAHIHARARRWTVKLFASHYQMVTYFNHYGHMPPKPYVLDILGHQGAIQIPNAQLVPGLAAAWHAHFNQ